MTTTTTPNKILDLHGLTKEKAIGKMTSYFDTIRRNNGNGSDTVFIVTIVTGSGSHSPRGPVLRTSVENTLLKRRMNFKLNPGKGAFTVDALSGIDLYADYSHPKSDSKLILLPASEQLTTTGRRPRPVKPSYPPPPIDDTDDPLPSEVAADDKLISSALRASCIETARRRAEDERADRRNLAAALEDSKQRAEEEGLRAAKEAGDEMERAIRESLGFEEGKLLEEEDAGDEMERAIRESLGFEEERSEEEEEAMRRAMEESLRGAKCGGANGDLDMERVTGDGYCLGVKSGISEEEAMRRAMEESLLGAKYVGAGDDSDLGTERTTSSGSSLGVEDGISGGEEEMKRVMEESLLSVNDEEEALKRAIEESMATAVVDPSQSEEDVLKRVIENSLIETTRNRGYFEEEKVIDVDNSDIFCTGADDGFKRAIENSMVDGMDGPVEEKGATETEMKRVIQCTLSLTVGEERSRRDCETKTTESSEEEEEKAVERNTTESLVGNSITTQPEDAKKQTFEDHRFTASRKTERPAPQCNPSLNFG